MATKTRQLADYLVVGGLSDQTSDIEVRPHIKPGVLHPAIAGKDVNGVAISTSHGSTYTYGTTHADGRMYYYTDIKGSKPIKDPRIGAHFGSQRHKAKSIQILEEETATHGKNVHSVDGRGWCRVVSGDNNVAWVSKNDNGGNFLQLGDPPTGGFIEITGYFNDINMLMNQDSDAVNDVDLFVNGTVAQEGNTTIGGDAIAYSPLRNRYVDKCCLIHGGATLSTALGTTPTINTLKILATNAGGEYFLFSGFELIAQDTTSTATRSKIQIPAQNVVSYGKKFAISAATPHYDPFNGFTSGNLAAVQALVDTATSLGVEGWNHSSTYYRPYNGGRVVRWIDSSGAIKTSVNMMPPNARSRTTAAIAAKANASVANTLYYPTFEAGAIDHSQAEVAKTFHFREFGNGAANGGTGASAWADPSMLSSSDHVAFVMDDGLTSLHGKDATSPAGNFSAATSDMEGYLTFIGTGVSFHHTSKVWNHMAQNLPYCTHIAKFNWTNGGKKTLIDGIEVADNFAQSIENDEFSIHQPKMPPIPEDSVVISDYMLMADTVQIPNTTAALDGRISKGMLRKDISRDYVIQPNSGSNVASLSVNPSLDSGFLLQNSTGQVLGIDLPHFGTKFMVSGESAGSGHWSSIYGGTAVSQTQIDNTSVANGMDKFSGPSTAKELEINKLELSVNNGYGSRCVDFNTPIHTSSHYQSFESLFLNELVGGDRNMEQNNLIVTPDGKSWDEVTRDTSYLGNTVVQMYSDNGADTLLWDMCRGALYSYGQAYQKDFAIAYDRLICLKSMECKIHLHDRGNTSADTLKILVNGGAIQTASSVSAGNWTHSSIDVIISLKRGDYVQAYSVDSPTSAQWGNFHITRLN